MKVKGEPFRSIWHDLSSAEVRIIDQRWLPHEFRVVPLRSLDDFAVAIRDMWVRGAPLIGATAAFGIAEQMSRDPSDAAFDTAYDVLHATRPTAINLKWALDRCRGVLAPLAPQDRAARAWELAQHIADEDVEINAAIGRNGLAIIQEIADRKPAGEPVRLLTHCNAGWLATVDWGTATSPMYHAHDAGIPIHVWVDETRPRNQGALTSWELGEHGIPHAYITDNVLLVGSSSNKISGSIAIALIPDCRPTTCSIAARYSLANPPCATITIPINSIRPFVRPAAFELAMSN